MLDPFDLHVLGIPPAFILSHDQTLSTKNNSFCKKTTKKDFFRILSGTYNRG